MIREGGARDVNAILSFGLNTVRSLPGLHREPNAQLCANYLIGFIEAPHGALFVSEAGNDVIGFICGYVDADPWTGEKVAHKASWVVDPNHAGHGFYLLKRFERWARESGASRMMISRLHSDDELGTALERMNYQPIEATYERTL